MGGTLFELHESVVQFLEIGLGQRTRLIPSAALGIEEYVGQRNVGIEFVIVAIGFEIRLNVLVAQACGIAGEAFRQVPEFLNQTAANDVIVPSSPIASASR